MIYDGFRLLLSSSRSLRTSSRLFTMDAIGTQRVDTSHRLAALRELMSSNEYNVNTLVVPSEDQHSSEYLANCDQRRAFISGFSGSAGTAVITLKDAFLFTDGRYFLQAGQQLDSNWTLKKQGLPDVPTWQEFVSKNLEKQSRVGVDPTLISAGDAESLRQSLATRESELVSLSDNLVDLVWGSDRPARPKSVIFPLDIKFSGLSQEDKLTKVREELKAKKSEAVIVSMLDEVAWLFNLRGSDIDFNPVFFAYAAVSRNSASLFVNSEQISDDVRRHLGDEVEVRSYESFFPYLKEFGASLQSSENPPVLIGEHASLAISEAIGHKKVQITASPVTDLKSIKNETELEGFRQSHIRDGAALARYFSWLEEQLENGVTLNESQAADQLEKYRSELDLYKGLSFTTISSTGPNGAIIHYSPDPNDCAIVRKDQIYLCDSGAQFLDGTTDVTRTWHFGTPTEQEKRSFTRVLQGHIAIDTAIFPNGTTGYIIDSWARKALWKDGLDYRHGTGHGVGSFLNVHEGPHGIGVRIAYNSAPLKAGMTVSNEPGFYEDGSYGIRIENIVLVREAATPNNFGQRGYLRFEHVTMCPIHKKLIDVSLIDDAERKWLNSYHEEVLAKVSPLLANDLQALNWLKRECSPL